MDQQIQSQLNWTLTIKEACLALKMARSKLYYLCDPKSPYFDPTFPKPIRIGKGSVRLDRGALLAWYGKQQIDHATRPSAVLPDSKEPSRAN
jgi:predicted DNA-binding transcriptional regulator AlpA